VEANSTGSQGSSRAVAPSDDDDLAILPLGIEYQVHID
jgi:hypothetical protein